MSRHIRIVTLTLVALALVAGPSASPATAGVIDYGAIASCRYRITQEGSYGWTAARLKKIVVSPPTVAKKDGTRTVGWRFIVQRSLDRTSTPWRVTYRSPLQREGKSADFTPMRVGVTVPAERDTPNGQDHVWYRVVLKMFWYRADGSVQAKIKHVMYDMYVVVDGEEYVDSYCPGLAQQFFDGP
jgi:hypothetical protein